MNKTNTQEEIINLFNKGLDNAARSMSALMRETIKVSKLSVGDVIFSRKTGYMMEGLDTDEMMCVLTTKLKGEFGGACCLLFSESDADRLRRAMLPPSLFDDTQTYEKMKDAILLEADNIIAAAVVTELSNQLKERVYGDVPKLRYVEDADELQVFAEECMGTYQPAFYLYANFRSIKDASFAPRFYWLMEQSFVDFVQTKL